MRAVANNPAFAKKVGVPQSVGKDFSNADKNRKFSKGGDTMASKMNPGFMAMMAKKKGMTKMAEGGKADMSQDKAMIKKAIKQHDAQEHKGGTGTKLALKKGGMTKMAKGGGIETKGKTKGTMIKMKSGGKAC